jgi:hypothetical protein
MNDQPATGWNPEAFESPDEAAITPLTVWRPSQFLAWEEPPGSHYLLPAFVTRGQLTTVIGQGGLGKSRLAGLWLPVCQITGREWCGLPTGGSPQRWLVLGDENSLGRIKTDLSKIIENLSPNEKALVEEHLRIQAIRGIEDTDLGLGDLVTRARIRVTIEAERPGGVIVDPLGNFASGDISKPHEMKETVRLLTSTVWSAAPEAAVVVLHHARTGRTNIAQGVGWDAANFATGGKTLFAAARCQINLMPGQADDDTRLVLSCAKANNCERFAPRGLIFEPISFVYRVDPDFDVDLWQAQVEGRARAGQSLCTIADVVAAVRDGYSKTKDLVAHLTDACAVSKRTVERLVQAAAQKQAIKPLTRGNFILGRKSAIYLETIT